MSWKISEVKVIKNLFQIIMIPLLMNINIFDGCIIKNVCIKNIYFCIESTV
jgi:hypothetical protein